MDDWTQLSRKAIRWLGVIIITSVGGIIALSVWGAALRWGVLGDGLSEGADAADEALSILGNVASAAVGAIAGWLTRDAVTRTTVTDGTGQAHDVDMPADDAVVDPRQLDQAPPYDAARPMAPPDELYADDDADGDEWLPDNDADVDDDGRA